MSTTLYILTDPAEGTDRAFPTKAEARAYRGKFYRGKGSRNIRIRQVNLANLGKRELLCAMFNHEQYAESWGAPF